MGNIEPDELDASEQYRTRNGMDSATKPEGRKNQKKPDPTLEDPEKAALVQPVSTTNKE